MTQEQAHLKFTASSPESQARILARVSHTLTIVARNTYESEGESVIDGPTLRRINELQHRLIGQIYKLLMSREDRYPDEVILNLLDGASGIGAHYVLVEALEQTSSE